MNSISEIPAVTAGYSLKSSRRFSCRSAAATWFVAIFSLVVTSSILSAAPVDELKAPYVSPSAVSVVKPDRRSPRTAPDPASRQAVLHRDLRKDALPVDISLFTGFPEPLKPVGDAAKDSTTSVLVTVINRWAVREKSDDFSLLEDFIGKFPSSTWTPAVRFNLAKLYYGAGYFTKAIEIYQVARNIQAGMEGVEADRYQSLVLAELAGLYARTGRQKELGDLLDAEKNRVFSDFAKIRLDQAREGLSVMISQPEIAFRCGTYALANVSKNLGREIPEGFMDAHPSTKAGFTLGELDKFAREQLSLPMVVVKRSAGQPIPLPSVVHLRCGHYGALLSEKDGLYQLSDPTFGADVWITARAIEDESSGYFIIPLSSKTNGFTAVPDTEAKSISGKGFVKAIDPKTTKKCDMSTSKCAEVPGMAAYRMHLVASSLSVSDIPLVIPTAYGPALSLEVTYNQREYEPSSTKLYTHFGPQWVSNRVSWISGSGSSITIYLPGGGSEVHLGFTSTSNIDPNLGYFDLQRESQTKVYRTGLNKYERRAQDGSKMVYERAISGGQVFLSQVLDPWGNALTYSYDLLYPARISTISAASGQTLYYFYEDSDPYLVTGAADEQDRSQTFRKVSFGYQFFSTVKRLWKVTDPLGIVSQFGYNPTGFMDTLTTPYGTSTFVTGDGSGDGEPLRWLEAIDPQGAKERLEFIFSMDENSIPVSPLPSGYQVVTSPEFRRYWNTFYWSKKAWAMAPNDRSKAHLYHWLHTTDSTGASGVLEMEKAAYENNVWYNYKGQQSSYLAGPSASPSIISQAIEKDDGTVITLSERYEYHPLTGNLTNKQVTWPFYGYESFNDYDPTGYELLQVRVANGNSLVRSYSNYLNRQPQTLIDAQGQPTTVAYHAVTGQIENVTNSLGEVTTYNYEADPAKNGYRMVLSIVGPQAGATTTFTYDSADRLKTATDSSNWTLTYSYDAFDRVTLIAYPDLTSEQFVYIHLDLFAKKDRQNRWTRTWHNAIREPIITADALGRITRYEWCRCGALQKLTDANGRTTSWAYDAQGRNTQKTYPDGRTEATTYQPLSGRVSTTTDSAGQIRTNTYNGDGTLKSKKYSNLAPGTAATDDVVFTYYPDYPRLFAITDSTRKTILNYYPVGQLGAMQLKTIERERFPASPATDLITYTYDALGRKKTTNVGPNGTENLSTWTYDNLGRIESTANPLGTFSHFHVGVTDRIDYINYPNGQKTSFGYYPATQDNRLQSITHLAVGTTPASILSRHDYTYLPEGNISTWQRQLASDPATATKFTLGYDSADQLTSATLGLASSPATVTQRYSYQYDSAGNRTSAQQGNLVNSAIHDNANRLTSLTGGGKLLVSGATDEPAVVKVNGQPATTTAPPENLYQAWVGVVPGPNILTVEASDYAAPPNTTTKSWSVSVTGSAARAFTYDGNGNTLSDGLRTYQWDAENRLVKITQGANAYEFIYDGLSRRVGEKLNGIFTKRWVWDGTQIAEQRDATGNTVQRQYYSQGEKRSGGTDAGNYYYTRDHLGSIREMIDSSAVVRARYDYDPYGSRSKLSGDLDCDFGFTGHNYHSASNLHLTLYRAYDQDLGRWLSADPIGEAGGMNLYAYVGGNPVNGVDPLGLWNIVGHNHIIDQAFKGHITPADLKSFKDASYNADFGEGSQDSCNSYKHAMSEPSEDPSKAQKRYKNFLKGQMREAVAAEKKGYHEAALLALGLGMHAIADSVSPTHNGNQPWAGTSGVCNKIDGLRHVLGELYPNPAQSDSASKGLQNYYDEFLRKSN